MPRLSAFASPGTFAVATPGAAYSGGPHVLAPPATYGTDMLPGVASPVTYGDLGDLGDLGKWRLKLPRIKIGGKAVKDITAWALAPATGGASVLARYATRRGKKGRAIIDVKRKRKPVRYRNQAPGGHLPTFPRQMQPRDGFGPGEGMPSPDMAPDDLLAVDDTMPAGEMVAVESSGPRWGLIAALGFGALVVLGGLFAMTRRRPRRSVPSTAPRPQRSAA